MKTWPFIRRHPQIATLASGPQVALSPQRWASDVSELTQTELDILIVGGGIVGAGTALEGVTRGLHVGVLEAQDWASGTSSRSSKLIHGGLRYLQMHDFALVKEALHERAILLKTAPHLVHPLSFLFPLRHRVWERAYIGAGIALYDLLAHSSGNGVSMPIHRQHSKKKTLELVPALRDEVLVGSITYFDAQVDDARYTMSVLRSAASKGALLANRVKAVGLLRDGTAVTGVRARNVETKEEFDIKAKLVISATGVWTEKFENLTGENVPLRLKPSKGIHVVVPRECIDSSTALTLQTEKSVLFVLPWGNHWIIGTTDTIWEYDLARPSACKEDVEYILTTLNSVLRTPLSVSDIESVYVGLRPLIAGAGQETTKLSREHAVNKPLPGLVLISGGKFTTYRVMAKDAINTAIDHAGLKAQHPLTEIPFIAGAEGFTNSWEERGSLATMSGLSQFQIERLLHRYGSLIDEFLEVASENQGSLNEIGAANGYLRAEAIYAVTHEGARHLDDVLERRTRISIETPDRGVIAAPEVAAIMATHLGWTEETIASEIEAYRHYVAAMMTAELGESETIANASLAGVTSLLELP